jgi:hypothetical protein
VSSTSYRQFVKVGGRYTYIPGPECASAVAFWARPLLLAGARIEVRLRCRDNKGEPRLRYLAEIEEKDGATIARVYRRGEDRPVALFACTSEDGPAALRELLRLVNERLFEPHAEGRPMGST